MGQLFWIPFGEAPVVTPIMEIQMEGNGNWGVGFRVKQPDVMESIVRGHQERTKC